MPPRKRKKKPITLESLSMRATQWVGTPQSIVAHSILFVGIFLLRLVGIDLDSILLILTTAVSLEAIYLAIFIQMTVNKNTESLEEVSEDIDDIQEDFEDLSEDVEDISEDIDRIQEMDEDDDVQEARTQKTLEDIETRLQQMLIDIDSIKKSPPVKTP